MAISVTRRGWQNGHAKHENNFLPGEEDGCCTDGDCAPLNWGCEFGVCDDVTHTCQRQARAAGSSL